MGFLSVKSGKAELQFSQLNHLSAQLQQNKQSLREVQTRLTKVSESLAQSLSESKSAYQQLSMLAAPALENRSYIPASAKCAHQTMQRMDDPNDSDAKVQSELVHRDASQTIDLLISKIDSQATLIALMKNQIIKPRFLRGKSTAQLMSGINQQLHALQWDVFQDKLKMESSIGFIMVKSAKFSGQAFDMREEVEHS